MKLKEHINISVAKGKTVWAGIIHPSGTMRHVIGFGSQTDKNTIEKYCIGALEQEVLELFNSMNDAVDWALSDL